MRDGEFVIMDQLGWKLWIPDGFEADELTEADVAEHYIGYYLSDDRIIAIQYFNTEETLEAFRTRLEERGVPNMGMQSVNGISCLLYRNEENESVTAAYAVPEGKMLELTFYPYSENDFAE